MPRIKLAAKIAVTAAILFALLRMADTHRVVDSLRNVSIGWLLLIYPISVASRAVQAAMLQSILRCVGETLSLWRIFIAGALSGFYGLIVPGELIASVAKWKNLSDATGRKSLVLSAIVYNRLVLILAPLGIGVIALWWRNPVPELPLAEITTGLFVAALLAGSALFHPRFGATLDRAVASAASPLPQFLSKRLEQVLGGLSLMREIPATVRAKHALLSMTRFGLNICSTKILLVALGFDVPVVALILLHSVLMIVMQMPLTLGGFGVREAIFMIVLGEYGVSQAVALAAGLLSFTTRFAFALVGGFYQIALMFDWADSRSR